MGLTICVRDITDLVLGTVAGGFCDMGGFCRTAGLWKHATITCECLGETGSVVSVPGLIT